jgi:colanic acid/amylovoran biosynthesis glycosyltransferase
MRDVLVELGCPASKAVIQRLGVDLDSIGYAERRRSGAVRVLLAATLREKKGVQDALEAVARSRAGGLDVRLTLIGEGPDEEIVARSIERLGLKEAVVRRPYVSHAELLAEFGRNDILIQPSVTARDGDTEGGLPVTIIEAAASGMPIVATTHCDIPEAVVNGRGGILVAERDAEALASALVELARRADEWPAMGAFNRERMTRLYDLGPQVRQLEALYDDVRG